MAVANLSPAAFGTHIEPERLRWPNSGCEEVGHLANHLLTRIPRLLGKSQTVDQKLLIQTKSSRIEVDINREMGATYFDFLEACMDPDSSLEGLSKVGLLVLATLLRHTTDLRISTSS